MNKDNEYIFPIVGENTLDWLTNQGLTQQEWKMILEKRLDAYMYPYLNEIHELHERAESAERACLVQYLKTRPNTAPLLLVDGSDSMKYKGYLKGMPLKEVFAAAMHTGITTVLVGHDEHTRSVDVTDTKTVANVVNDKGLSNGSGHVRALELMQQLEKATHIILIGDGDVSDSESSKALVSSLLLKHKVSAIVLSTPSKRLELERMVTEINEASSANKITVINSACDPVSIQAAIAKLTAKSVEIKKASTHRPKK